MRFTRKRISYSEIQKPGVISDLLTAWGFVNLDGSSLTENPNFLEDHDPYTARWKNDTNNQCYFKFNSIAATSSQDRTTNMVFTYSDNSNHIIADHLQKPRVYSGTPYYTLFFIPLKNNGFFFQWSQLINISSLTYDHLYPDEDTQYSPTPPLRQLSDQTYTGKTQYSSTFGWGNVQEIIGFFNNVTGQYNYIHLGKSAYFNSTLGSDVYCSYWNIGTNYGENTIKFDFQNGSVKNDSFRDLTGDYTDVKSNVCTLARYPFENSFLDNLFIISTAPQAGSTDANGLDTKFFSFGGRNFLGIHSNLAVELPTN